MGQQLSQDIADAWARLNRVCIDKQVPIDIAEAQVQRYINIAGLNEFEAIYKVFKEIVYN